MPTAKPDAADTTEIPDGHVRVRITKHGDGQVASGEFPSPSNLFPSFRKDDRPVLPRSVAQSLEDRAFAEIED